MFSNSGQIPVLAIHPHPVFPIAHPTNTITPATRQATMPHHPLHSLTILPQNLTLQLPMNPHSMHQLIQQPLIRFKPLENHTNRIREQHLPKSPHRRFQNQMLHIINVGIQVFSQIPQFLQISPAEDPLLILVGRWSARRSVGCRVDCGSTCAR